MNRLIDTVVVALAIVAAGATRTAHAGRTCESTPPDAWKVQQAMELASRTAHHLEETGAHVVVIARAGQDLSRYGLQWSHLGLAYRANGRWFVVHKLNQCGSSRASLYRQGLGEFFLDDLHLYRAGIAVLSPDLQARLLPVLQSNAAATRMHTPAYSMVAYPWAQVYQQSNQWALETMAMAQEPAATNRERAQAWLRLQAYRPTTLRLSPLQRLGARVTAAHIAFDDHPDDKRYSSRIETVTVDSVFAWLERSGLAAPVQDVR